MNDPLPSTENRDSRSAFQFNLYWLWLLPVFLFSRFCDQWLTDQTFVAMNAKSGGVFLLFLYGILTFISSAFFPVLATLIILMAWRLRRAPFWPVFEQIVKEELRAFGSIMNWSFLLLIPGLYKMVQYVFVPWVVALDPNYERGDVDALAESKRLFFRTWWILIPYVIVTMILVPLLLTSFDSYRSFADYPVGAAALTSVDLALFVLFQWVLLKIWRKALRA